MAELWDVSKQANQRLEAGYDVLWRREQFGPGFDQAPKWHRLAVPAVIAGPDSPDRWNWRWTAMCGYEYTFDGLMGRRPDVRDKIKTARLRCRACDKERAMLLQRGDRVRITGILPDDPAPLPIGLEGTVTTVMNQATALEQIAVDWDLIPGAERPRSVMLLPGDPFEKILTEEQKPAPRTRRPAAPRKPRAAPKPTSP